jgi:hypothetical protein
VIDTIVRQAWLKFQLCIRSVRAGFGSTGKWAWLLPAKPVKPAKKGEDHTTDVIACEQAGSVNLNGLPIERAHPSSLGSWNRPARKP